MRRKKTARRIEEAVPVSAFCFLKQAKKDRIEFIGPGQASISIFQHSHQNTLRSFHDISKNETAQVRNKIMENACQAAKTIPAYILEAKKNGKFWEELDKILA